MAEQETQVIIDLKEFAEKSNRQIDYLEEAYPSTAVHPVAYHVRQVCIPLDEKREVFYVSFGNSREFSHYANYSGVFFLIDAPKEATITIRQRDILDKLNPFLKESEHKSINKEFNNAVVLEENDIFTAKSLLGSARFQKLVPTVFKIDQKLRVGINEIKIDFIEELKDKSFIGIYMLNDWLVAPEKIEQLLGLGQELNNILNY